ncbi:bifunctional metallophosphatase/5'-nucleotidase [Vagococcus coleopterorum]|uniref:Bifunctional metallophosphatase/5'-nucleotidase n=1 Tax=Vagococcus coleopterorum TaxID=2714946 RepID=A0A6G8AMS5_9ENTE|nr:bifunctional metallophosphatase/5'-nucleotidase [Vagococcus coleopterorum]QIL46368.1 bifunctional metallophosphatase/5'-nucleotidase [Vagococcus coleopterorum]
MKCWRTVLKATILLSLMVGSGVVLESEAIATNTVPIQILSVNDFHGSLDSIGTVYIEGKKIENTGALKNLATHLNDSENQFKEKHPDGETVRIQAGDIVGASPANSALLQDEPAIRAFDLMGFSIGVLGNHEFDEGLKEYKRALDGREPVREDFGPTMDDDLWKVLKDYPRSASREEIVIANVENKADGEFGKKGEIPYGFKPYTIKKYGEGDDSVKVAYLGVVTSEFPNLVLAQHTESFNVLDEAETMAKYSKELREEQGVNAIVVITHIPAVSSDGVVEGDVVDIMGNVDKLDPDNSIDVVFAAHNHQFTNGIIHGKNDVRVVQSVSHGKAYVDVQGTLDPSTQDFTETPKAEVIPNTDVGEDRYNQDVQKIVDEANELIKPITEASIINASVEKMTKDPEGRSVVTSDSNSHNESPLGNLVTDAQLYMANTEGLKDADGNEVHADFALTNDGGIRADLIADKNGELTWGAIQTVQPFGNILQVVEIKGSDLRSALNEQFDNDKLEYFLQFSGLKMSYQGVGSNFEVTSLTDDEGAEIEDDKNYNIVINDFLFGGGDGFKSFKKGKLVTAMDADTSVFINYFKKLKTENKKVEAPEVGRKIEVKADGKENKDSPKNKMNSKKIDKKIIATVSVIGGIILIGLVVFVMNKKKK